MNIAYLGQGPLDEAVLSRLAVACRVERAADAQALQRLAADSEVLVLGSGADAVLGRSLTDHLAAWPAAAFGRIGTVVDQRLQDPEQAQALAAALARSGVALVDAPVHCEQAQHFPARAATLCGGSDEALARVRPLLEAMGAPVIAFAGVGSGHSARALVGAAAACNRMATYECAATGLSKGLSIADMALVLNRSSGANSAAEHVLPHIGTGVSTSDLPIATAVQELRIAGQLAMRAGTPLLLANLVGGLCQSLANGLPEGAGFDDALARTEAAGGPAQR